MADQKEVPLKSEDSGVIYEDKKAVLAERLLRREEDRQDMLNKQREEKASTSAEREDATIFLKEFLKLKKTISEILAQTGSIPQTSVADHLGKIGKEINQLTKYITDSTIYLPSYDIQKYQSVLGELQNEFQRVQVEFLPKKKFAFKSRYKMGNKDSQKKETEKASSVEFSKFNIELNEISIKDKVDETVTLSESDIDGKDVVLANLQNCTVQIQGVGSSMQIDKLVNCRILGGPILRSIFINSCSNCMFILACQQLRIHHTNNTTFFIHVTTRAIIEDTTNVKFGQYCQKYPKFQEHWTKCGLDKSKNNWNDIDDFNYLASDARSPNWSLVTADEQTAMEQNL